jgi:preprotein translocase subunit SecY
MNELARRIAFTIGALLIYRFGSHIPVVSLWTPTGPLPEGAILRVSIFSLGIVPYLTAAVIIRLLSMVWGRLNALERSGQAGRSFIARGTLILTLFLAAFQGYGIASALRGTPGLVDPSDGWFPLAATASMVGGVFLVIWLCEQITRHGIGNGLALVLSINILASLPESIATEITALRQGIVSSDLVLLHVLSWVIAVASMVAVEGARRNVRVEFAERKVGSRLLPPRSSVLPIKLNSAGLLIPVTVAPWFWSLPLAFAVLFFGAREPWLVAAQRHIAFGEPAHLIIGSLLIFVLVFVYTSYVVDPDHAADRLAKHGGTIPGVAPGEPTADYLDRLVSLTTVVGAIYLTAVSLFPELLVARGAALPYEISGGSALIVVCTILDIRKQVRDLLRINARGGRQ